MSGYPRLLEVYHPHLHAGGGGTSMLAEVAPIASIVYSAKTNYWVPTLAATGVAAVTLPISIFDYGITFAVAPPVTSAVLLQTKVQEKRRKLGIVGPEEADSIVNELT